MIFARLSAFALVLCVWSSAPRDSEAHGGALDANGCHYDSSSGRYHCHRDPPPNPDTTAPVKKSRTNICHDATSPNYTQLVYFIPFPSMAACLKSGGRRVR
jgi:hypothetical protein